MNKLFLSFLHLTRLILQKQTFNHQLLTFIIIIWGFVENEVYLHNIRKEP